MKATKGEGGQGATEIIAARGEWGAEPVQGRQEGSQPRDVQEEAATEPGDTAGRRYSYSTKSARTGLHNKFRQLKEKKKKARKKAPHAAAILCSDLTAEVGVTLKKEEA